MPEYRNVSLIIRQIYQLGVLSILIIACSGFAIGAVLALQGYTQLVRVGSESALGLGVALVLVMEIGPVVSALLFAGRAGSAVTAEIGLMKATEQLASMEMIGVDPIKQLSRLGFGAVYRFTFIGSDVQCRWDLGRFSRRSRLVGSI